MGNFLSSGGWVLVIALGMAVVDWVAVIRGERRLELFAKPMTLALVIIGAWLLAKSRGGGHLAGWFVVALVFSLIGDVCLMLRGNQWFLLGLVAFLVAHLCYIVGLNSVLPPVSTLGLLAGVAILDGVALRSITQGMLRSGAAELRIPVVIYGVVLSLTLYSGWATWFRPSWSVVARTVASVGATLFFVSDLMLAWDRFVRRSRALHIAVIVTYHIAQLALASVVAFAP